MLCAVSCEFDDVDEVNERNNSHIADKPEPDVPDYDKLPELKIAVVLPLDNSYRPRFERVAIWAFDNITEATKGVSFNVAPEDVSGIKINIEWFDENVIDAEQLARELSVRKDISAIIGPMFSSDAQYFALECAKTGMNILLPCTTSSEVVRKFSGKPWFWSFAETDIRQCQVMLETAVNDLSCNSVSLITSTSFYGQTFLNWLPFEAREKGLSLSNVYLYDDALSQQMAEQAMNQSVEGQAIIGIASEVSDVLTIQNAVINCNPKGKVILSDIAMDPSLLDFSALFQGALGIGITADENSGFLDEYIQKYSQEPTEGECQFYDALVLMSLVAANLYDQGLYDAQTENSRQSAEPYQYNAKVSETLAKILAPGSGQELFLTKTEDIKTTVESGTYNIRGASGHIDFDKANRSSVAHSTYQLWTIQDRAFSTLKLIQETPMSVDAWEAEVTKIQDIQTADVDIEYQPLSDQWALLVAGSQQWSDYRHQADVLMVYQLLKEKGFPDSHIILIMEDNIATSPENPYQGKVLDYSGNNLYDGVHVDYNLSDLSASDISDILSGRKSDRLSKVIESNNTHNIFVYWSGNGNNNELTLSSNNIGFTSGDFITLMQNMSQPSRKYRKMLWLVDASHAESVTSIADGQNIPGVLCINSSAAQETSLADQCDFDEIQQTYLATRFTKVFVEQMRKTSASTYYSIYENLAKYTSGSHVNISNADRFDNLKTSDISEFIIYRARQ